MTLVYLERRLRGQKVEDKIGPRLNDFATRCFRDQADADYIAARLACYAHLVTPFHWSSEQAIEKYLKCIILLIRVEAPSVKHHIHAALNALRRSDKLTLQLTAPTEEFLKYIDAYGKFRYLESSQLAFGRDIVNLDRAVWELRRYCTLSDTPRKKILSSGVLIPRVRIPGGYLEKIIDDARHPARKTLLRHNGFFGKARRWQVKVPSWFTAINAPLFLHPEIVEEVKKYVYLPPNLVKAYQEYGQARKLAAQQT